jgi:hypothetical protein
VAKDVFGEATEVLEHATLHEGRTWQGTSVMALEVPSTAAAGDVSLGGLS